MGPLRRVLPALLLLACGGADPPAPVVAGGPVVMVIDTGFDLSLPVFAGKIAAAYTLACTPAPGDGGAPPDAGAAGDADGGTAGFAEIKAAFLAALGSPDDICEPNRDIPIERFPGELLYDPRPGVTRRALTAARPSTPRGPLPMPWALRWVARHKAR